ncbi:hypothetical protein [Reyranella sp.]|uniref:hypothetical protein n=1 Tax=Reyranella sp. TaxID=1929291 RepID=UPI0037849E77
MAVDWADYEAFAWSNAKQDPMDGQERAKLAARAADLLELDAADREAVWGHASPPGRYAATVIRVAPQVSHRFRPAADRARIDEVGLKLFKLTPDAARAARRACRFHNRELGRLPGLPNPRVQRSISAGLQPDGCGPSRGYVVQEWVRGASLEDCLRVTWTHSPVDGALVRGLLAQLFGDIVVPLWQAGTVWWDFRDANFCYDAQDGLLRVIDVDSLGAYADEILRTPQRWQARDKGRATALARLRRMSVRLLGARQVVAASKIERGLQAAWREFEPALRRLGHAEGAGDAARVALGRFIDTLERMGLLGNP